MNKSSISPSRICPPNATIRAAVCAALGLVALPVANAQVPEMKYTYTKVAMPAINLGSPGGLRPPLQSSAPFDIQILPGQTLGGNAAALAAFNRAAAQWERYISDPVTVVISADLVPDNNPFILGGASSTIFTYPFYGTAPGDLGLVDLMRADNKGSAYQALTDALPGTEAGLNFKMDLDDAIVTGPSPYGQNGSASKANFKALGVPTSFLDTISPGTGIEKTYDATIEFNSNQAFDFDRSNGITPGTIDFESVAAHEIGHALGFFSDVDFADIVHNIFGEPYVFATPTTLDLFRFEDDTKSDPANLTDFGSFERSFQTGVPANTDLILNGPGGAPEKPMSTGALDPAGDGNQASHWKDDEISLFNIGLMDPTLARGQTYYITESDLAAMDVIGWDAAVPEVSALVPAGLVIAGGIAWQIRRRRTMPTVAAAPQSVA